jgi:hypothetical protein
MNSGVPSPPAMFSPNYQYLQCKYILKIGFISPFLSLSLSLFWWDWGLNSGLRICKAGTLLLKSHLQPSFSLVILEMESYLLGLS